MAQTEESVLQAMYEHEVKKNESNSHEYVVRGATVKCGGSKKTCALNLPKDHGEYTVDKRPLITINDVTADNVGFGTCDLTGDTCVPSLSKWSYTGGNMKIKDSNTQKDEYTVTKYSTAKCTKGQYSATVRFENSGQVIPEYTDKKLEGAIELKEDIEEEWSRGKDNKDFLGHIKINNTGVYNFGIKFYKSLKYYGGSVFYYSKNNNVLKFIGASALVTHENEQREGFAEPETELEKSVSGWTDPDTGNFYPSEYPAFQLDVIKYWKIWVDILLIKGKDYYFELDCPSLDQYTCKVIGNEEQYVSSGDYGGACWELDKSIEALTVEIYLSSTVLRHILYFDENYLMMLDYILSKSIAMEAAGFNKADFGKNLVLTGIGLLPDAAIPSLLLTILDMIIDYYDNKTRDDFFIAIQPYVSAKKRVKIELFVTKLILEDLQTSDLDYYTKVSDWNYDDNVIGNKYFKGELVLLPKSDLSEEYEKTKAALYSK